MRPILSVDLFAGGGGASEAIRQATGRARRSRYITTKVNGRSKLLHRHIMEQHIGRPLDRDEHVHHVNGDRHDNRIENLEVVSAAHHLQEHAENKRRHPNDKTCDVCGVTFTPHRTKRKRARVCSWACRSVLLSRIQSARCRTTKDQP